jgi:hypothetical protein
MKGETVALPAQRGNSLTTLGFLNLDLRFESYLFEGAVNAEVVRKFFDDFSQ